MNERGANIDLAFRNGLKDYEVLPPPDVWNSIDRRLVRKPRSVYYLRAAAFLAIAMTMSVLAYRWTGRTISVPDNQIMALNEESSAPLIANHPGKPVSKTTEFSGSAGLTLNIVAEKSTISEEKPVAGYDNAISIRMPEANLRIPFEPSSAGIIHRKSVFPAEPKNTLTVDNTGPEYPGYADYDVPAEKTSHWSISALATPTYYGKFSTGSDDLSRQVKASEDAVVSYTGGVALAYNVNKRFSIQSGLFYSSVGQELNGINSFAGFQNYDNTKGDHNFEVLTTNGTIYTNNADVFLFADGNPDRIKTNYNNDVFDPQKASLDYVNNTMRQNFSYLELPVFLRYKLVDRSVDFNLIGGFSYNLLVDNSVYTVIDGNKYMIGTTQGLNMFSISSSLGMGMEYKFNNKLSLNLEPTFRYYLNTFNSIGGSTFHPYSFGIFSGISYKF